MWILRFEDLGIENSWKRAEVVVKECKVEGWASS